MAAPINAVDAASMKDGNAEEDDTTIEACNKMDIDDSREEELIFRQPQISTISMMHADKDVLKKRMLSRLSNSDAHFKHQQRGEPDLTKEEKFDIADSILNKNPVMFLSRFKNFILLEDLDYFKDQHGNYEVDFYLAEIRKLQNEEYQRNTIKNRRYEAMKQFMSQGDYFSQSEMKRRDPYLYEQLIGQYLSADDIQENVLQFNNFCISEVLTRHMDQMEENALYMKLRDKEEEQFEEEDSDYEETEDEESEAVTEKQKALCREEFLHIMQQRFLDGQDRDFDYNTVDSNESYDSLDIREQDEEERYFDEEEPCLLSEPE